MNEMKQCQNIVIRIVRIMRMQWGQLLMILTILLQ